MVGPTCSFRRSGSLEVVVVGATTSGCVVATGRIGICSVVVVTFGTFTVVEVVVEEVVVVGGSVVVGSGTVVVSATVEDVGEVDSGTSGGVVDVGGNSDVVVVGSGTVLIGRASVDVVVGSGTVVGVSVVGTTVVVVDDVVVVVGS